MRYRLLLYRKGTIVIRSRVRYSFSAVVDYYFNCWWWWWWWMRWWFGDAFRRLCNSLRKLCGFGNCWLSIVKRFLMKSIFVVFHCYVLFTFTECISSYQNLNASINVVNRSWNVTYVVKVRCWWIIVFVCKSVFAVKIC